ncbi:MAG: SurA N-terminal domain-containing protein [Candidatus Omnitrophica bacterium]|nr:SurA N-terminal domain-containing protein [Candidatus Omnitrophota bacterium]
MLKILRDKKLRKTVFIVLSLIIIPAFALWGFIDAAHKKKEPASIGKIFGHNITPLEFKEAADAVRISAIMQFGDKFEEVKKYLNFDQQAWERLILIYEAKNRNIKASDKEVIELIESYPFFQRNKQFDQKIYAEILRYVFRIQPRAFEEQTRKNIIISKLYKQITDKVKVTDTEIKEEYRRANEEISVSYIAAIPSELGKTLNPADSEVKEYFDKNSLQFKQPLSFNLIYATDESDKKINNLLEKINKKIDFNQAAKELSLEVKETGFFNSNEPIPGIGWAMDILKQINNLEIGKHTPVVNIEKKYYLFELKDKKEAFIPEFDKIKDKVKETLIKEQSSKIAKEKIEKALSELKEASKLNKNSVNFEKVAKTNGLKAENTKPFKYGSYIEGIGGTDNFWTQAQLLKENEFSQVINMPSGYFIIKMKARLPVDEKKFESEKSDFSKQLLSQKQQEEFGKFIEKLKK